MKTKFIASILVSISLMLSACGGSSGPALYTISGNVTDPNNGHADVLANVTVALEGDQTQTASTDGNGNYRFSVPNGEYRVTPTMGSAVFDPLDNVLEVMDGHVNGVNFAVAPGMPTQAVNTWRDTRSMTYKRELHTATLLTDGRVLIAGGETHFGSRASAELYDPATGKWTTTGSMNHLRTTYTATRLGNGNVLVTGGSTGSAIPLASAEFYDPTTGKWTATSSLNHGRMNHTATLLTDGRVLVVGGEDFLGTLASAEIYAPQASLTGNQWQLTGSLNHVRLYHTATLLTDGRVLVVGGQFARTSAEIYDPVTGLWSTAGAMADKHSNHTATLLADGRVLVVDGSDPGDSVRGSAEIYNPVTGQWTKTSSLVYPRQYHSATLLRNNKVLVTGGSNNSNRASSELYDPATGTWSTVGELKYRRDKHTATLLNDGMVLAAGGSAAIVGVRASAELFYPGN
jgi:N-acetylneuraminic acid mutarotase